MHVVVPEGIDDPASPSGGNVYDRRVCRGLTGDGWDGARARGRRAGGRGPTPPPARSWAPLSPRCPTARSCSSTGWWPAGCPRSSSRRRAGSRSSCSCTCRSATSRGAPPELAAREREVLAAAAAVVATSPWAARRVVALHGLDPARVAVAAPGVDPAPRAPGTGTARRLLCVGALTPTKGQDLLVARARRRPATCRGPARWSVRCATPGTSRRSATRSSGTGSTAGCALTGPLTGAALDAAYAAADLLVVPSRAETYGMVVTEALARGIPVLASDAGGLPETLGRDPGGRVPGVVVPSGDVAALAAALRGWLIDSGRRAELRRRAHERGPMLHGWEVTSRCVARSVDRAAEGPARLGRPPEHPRLAGLHPRLARAARARRRRGPRPRAAPHSPRTGSAPGARW